MLTMLLTEALQGFFFVMGSGLAMLLWYLIIMKLTKTLISELKSSVVEWVIK
jgi:hypothetical protein